MKNSIIKTALFSLLVSISTPIFAQFQIRNDAAIQLGYDSYRYLSFGQETNSPNNGKFALEYCQYCTPAGFNIWKPWPTPGMANYLLFIRDNGNIGIGNSGDNSFKLNVSGSVKATAFSTLSDMRLKTDIKPLQSSLEKLMKLNGVNYRYKYEFNKYPNSIQDTDEVKVNTIQNDTKISSSSELRMGLIAQDVKAVIPEVVQEDENGYLSINYSDIVPLLIESIKQQQVQIEELKKQLSYANTNKIVSKSFLEQNNPNPFATLTDLPYFIDESDKASNAVVTVYDKDGNLYKSFPVEAKAGFGKISFDCTACNTGLYIYTLQLNSKVVDTKVMLLYR